MKKFYVIGFAVLMILWGLFPLGDSYGMSVYFCDSTSENSGRSLYLLKQDGTATGQRSALASGDVAFVSGSTNYGSGGSTFQTFVYDANSEISGNTEPNNHPHYVKPVDSGTSGVWVEAIHQVNLIPSGVTVYDDSGNPVAYMGNVHSGGSVFIVDNSGATSFAINDSDGNSLFKVDGTGGVTIFEKVLWFGESGESLFIVGTTMYFSDSAGVDHALY